MVGRIDPVVALEKVVVEKFPGEYRTKPDASTVMLMVAGE